MRERRAHRRAIAGSVAALVAAGGFLVALATPATASGTNRFVATSGSDARDCTDPNHPCKTIQRAVDEAASGDSIFIAAGTYAGATVDKSLLIHGSSDQPTVTGSGANPTFAVGSVLGVITVRFESLNISGNSDGIGIRSIHSTVAVDNSSIDDNHGGLFGALSNLTLTDSSVDGNAGYGIDNRASGTSVSITDSEIDSTGAGSPGTSSLDTGEGVEMADGTLTVSGTTLDGNAGAGVDLYGDGLSGAAGSIQRSTLSDNATGLVVGSAATATVGISTIAGNHRQGIDSDASSHTVVRRTTIARNETHPSGSASERAGVFARAAASSPATVLDLGSTIVADNGTSPDCSGTVGDSGYNLSSDAAGSCRFSAAEHDRTKAEAHLGPLQDNGDGIDDIVPGPGSAAIDAIPLGRGGCDHSTDQNGTRRPLPAGGRCDIGAVEAPVAPILVTPTTLPHAAVGESYRAQLHASGGTGTSYVFTVAPGTALPAGLALSRSGLLSGTPTRAGTYTVSVSVSGAVRKIHLVVDAANGSHTANGNGAPIAATGVPATALGVWGAVAVLLGALLVVAGLTPQQRRRVLTRTR